MADCLGRARLGTSGAAPFLPHPHRRYSGDSIAHPKHPTLLRRREGGGRCWRPALGRSELQIGDRHRDRRTRWWSLSENPTGSGGGRNGQAPRSAASTAGRPIEPGLAAFWPGHRAWATALREIANLNAGNQ